MQIGLQLTELAGNLEAQLMLRPRLAISPTLVRNVSTFRRRAPSASSPRKERRVLDADSNLFHRRDEIGLPSSSRRSTVENSRTSASRPIGVPM